MSARRATLRRAIQDALLFVGEMARCHRCESCAHNAQQWMRDHAGTADALLAEASAHQQVGPNLDSLRDVVPQLWGEAIQKWPMLLGKCEPHEWDNRTTTENAIWLIGVLQAPSEASPRG